MLLSGLEAGATEEAADATFHQHTDLADLFVARRHQCFTHLKRAVLGMSAGDLAPRLLNLNERAGTDVGAEAGGAVSVDRAEPARRLFLHDVAAEPKTLADLLLEVAVDLMKRANEVSEPFGSQGVAYGVLSIPPLAEIVTFIVESAPT